jgi:hypothetical protein
MDPLEPLVSPLRTLRPDEEVVDDEVEVLVIPAESVLRFLWAPTPSSENEFDLSSRESPDVMAVMPPELSRSLRL